jgi:epoxyqueuosine reductase QueG
MSIKSKLLEEIEAKAQKIREKRIEAASNKTIEVAVFEFFKNIEESRKIHNNEHYDSVLFTKARSSLQERLRGFDSRVKFAVEYNPTVVFDENTVRGVTVWWSQAYIKKHNVDPSLYIDVSQMLFI